MTRVLRLFGVLAGVAVLAAACQWPMVRFGPERTGYSPSETTISPANVGQLTEQWTASLIGPGSDPVVDNGQVFVTATENSVASGLTAPGSYLYSFDTGGANSCTSNCAPVWSDPFSSPCSLGEPETLSAPAVDNGDVWVENTGLGNLCDTEVGTMSGYDVNTGAQVVSGTAEGSGSGSPVAANGTVYGAWTAIAPGEYVAAYEAINESTGAPLFTTQLVLAPSDEFSVSPPAVASGTLYGVTTLGSQSTLDAFDAAGVTNCSPYGGIFPEQCQPLWTAQISGTVDTTPAVANGYVYIGDSTGTLYAFPAGGCGAATCAASWTAQTKGAIESSPAVTATTVYVGSDDGGLYAFPATGCGASSCGPLWRAKTGGTVKSSPSVAGDVVYVGSDDDDLYAFNASGCGAATCRALWSTNVGAPIETSPAISNGQVFVTDTAGTLHAYGLPTSTSS